MLHPTSRVRHVPQDEDGPRPEHVQLGDSVADLPSPTSVPAPPIPSERDLMTTYDVSRATVRRAIDSLVVGGLLDRIPARAPSSPDRAWRPTCTSRRSPTTCAPRPASLDPAHARRRGASARGGGPGPAARRPRHCVAHRPVPARRRPADGARAGVVPVPPLPDLDTPDLTGSLYTRFASRLGPGRSTPPGRPCRARGSRARRPVASRRPSTPRSSSSGASPARGDDRWSTSSRATAATATSST